MTLGRVESTPDLRVHLMADPSGRLFLMLWGGMAAIGGARYAGAPATIQMAVTGVLLMVCSLKQPSWVAVALAMTAWLLITGFVVNRYGDLHVSGTGDLFRLSVLGLLALVAARRHGENRDMPDHHRGDISGPQAWNR